MEQSINHEVFLVKNLWTHSTLCIKNYGDTQTRMDYSRMGYT